MTRAAPRLPLIPDPGFDLALRVFDTDLAGFSVAFAGIQFKPPAASRDPGE